MQFRRCMKCMGETTGYPCPHCGYDPAIPPASGQALKPGTILNGRYLVGCCFGQSRSDLTYAAWDLAKEQKVAVKEFFPVGQVLRYPGSDVMTWYPTPESQELIDSFVRAAKKMAAVANVPEAAHVLDVFRENDTAYFVMDFIEGETLKEYLKRTGPLSWEQAQKIFCPAIEAMAQVHKAGLIHRDITPDDLMITHAGQVRILNLSTDKDLNRDTGDSSMPVVKKDFSPMDQYLERGNSGPWTDVYAMAATIWFTITGQFPQESIDRMVVGDRMTFEHPNVPAHVSAALKKAMAIRPEDRTQSMPRLLQDLQPSMVPQPEPAQPAPEHRYQNTVLNCSASLKSRKPLVPGAYITFGHYMQYKNIWNRIWRRSEPIEWLILNIWKDKAFLISRYGLDAKQYHTDWKEITWEKSSLRSWLNKDFLAAAFSEKEQQAILLTNVDNSWAQGYSGWSTTGGNNTQDKIFLLSYAEANEYFGVQHLQENGAEYNMRSRISPTVNAKEQGAWTSGLNKTADGTAAGWWWLRSPGNSQNYAALVDSDGSLYGSLANASSGLVRPVLWIDLKSDIFKP